MTTSPARCVHVSGLRALGFAVGLAVLSAAAAQAQTVEWVQRVVSGPSARERHAMAYDSARGQTVLFGGDPGAGFANDTWLWNGTAWTLASTTGPSPRVLTAMAFDSARGVTVLFGGYTFEGQPNAETWEWNGTTWTQRAVTGPSVRYNHAMAYDSARGVTVLYGGRPLGGGFSDETWEWDGNLWTFRGNAPGGLGPRESHGMAFDSARAVTVVWGGACCGYGREPWEWNGSTWTVRSVPGPTEGRQFAPLAYDSARGVSVTFSGQFATDTDVWEWSGAGVGFWNRRAITGPAARWLHPIAYDSGRGVTVLFGGTHLVTGARLGDTWELCTAPAVTAQPSAQSGCSGVLASFTVTAVGSGPLAYSWRHAGMAIGAAANPSATTPTLTIAGISAADAGSYDCVVTNGCGSATSSPATLTVFSPPSAAAPQDDVACIGFGAAFQTTPSGTGPFSFHWRHNEVAMDPIDNPTILTAALSLYGVTIADAGSYDCVVTNACGNVTSSAAVLTVSSSDFDNDGDTGTDADIETFFACLAGDCCPACGSSDFNGDGDVGTDADIEAFFRVLAGGTC
jgi:hypothetical protein